MIPVSVTFFSNLTTSLDELAKRWQNLESQADNGFFLSWTWIKHWLSELPYEYTIIEARSDEKIVGLGILVEHTRYCFKLIPIKQWWLHRSGREKYDQCWPEYNDFLLNKRHKSYIRTAMIQAIAKKSEWRELVVGMMAQEVESAFNQAFSAKSRVISDKGYFVNFNGACANYASDVLSKNSRQKLNQTERLLKEEGELSFRILSNKEKLPYLPELKKRHIDKWEKTQTPSGFSNVAFDNMLSNIIQLPVTELAILQVNDAVLGYLVNFVYREKVYFYLSALKTHDNSKIKIGMLIHKKAIEYYQLKGVACYDFLVGDNRYKKSLSNEGYTQTMVCYYRASVVLKFEQYLKKIKQGLQLNK